MHVEQPGSTRSRLFGSPLRFVLYLTVVALIASGVTLVARARSTSGPVDLDGHRVALEAGVTPDPATLKQMHASDDIGERFRVPSVDLDVPLGALTMVDNTITPPGFTSAYLVRNLGVSPRKSAHGTVFVAMHSLRGGAVGPGNHLIDVTSETARVRTGARIAVGSAHYEVTGTRAIKKTDIRRQRSVWQDTPGRLVVITCLQRPDGGPSVDNIVITARLLPPDTDR